MSKVNFETVSSDEEPLILVDEQDQVLGSMDKSSAHDGEGTLHRALSVFLFNSKKELLLQKRASGKRLWGGYWSNSCCSHPRWGEETADAAKRRVQQELGVVADLEYLYKFIYRAHFGEAGSEYELCSVYAGVFDGEPVTNALEIASWRWVTSDQLTREIAQSPDHFTPWMKQEWLHITENHQPLVA